MRKYVRGQGALWGELLNTRRENRQSRWILLYTVLGFECAIEKLSGRERMDKFRFLLILFFNS